VPLQANPQQKEPLLCRNALVGRESLIKYSAKCQSSSLYNFSLSVTSLLLSNELFRNNHFTLL